MNYKDYALNEFRVCGWVDEKGNYSDASQKNMCEHMLDLLDVFYKEGPSGASAEYTINMFTKLANFEPLKELTGEANEWNLCPGSKTYQNKRCSHVFKDSENGKAYDIFGIMYHEEDGCPRYEHKDVSFPYSPKTQHLSIY